MMVKETICANCCHLAVCSIKEEFATVGTAVINLSVTLSDGRMKKLCDFDYIEHVALICKHFERARTMR